MKGSHGQPGVTDDVANEGFKICVVKIMFKVTSFTEFCI